MKKLGLMGVCFAVCTIVSGAVWAVNITGNKTIVELRQSHPNAHYELVLNSALTGSNDNPGNCNEAGIAEIDATIPAAQRDLLNRTALAAYLGGKTVKLGLRESGSTLCQNNHPIVLSIRVLN